MDERLLAEFIGIMLGDGYFVKNRLKITLNSFTDRDYLDYVSNIIYFLFLEKPIIKYRKNENAVDIFLFKRKILNYLSQKRVVYSPKWGRAKIPSKFLKFGGDVLRGYFDTDGCVVMTNNNGTMYPRLEMKICPSPMQRQFIEILSEQGFNFGVYSIGKGKIRIQMNGKKQLNKWLNNIGFGNEKHLIKALRFVKNKNSGERI